MKVNERGTVVGGGDWPLCVPPTVERDRRACSARTGRTVFSQLSAAVVRHKANDGAVYATRAWFKYDTALSAVV